MEVLQIEEWIARKAQKVLEFAQENSIKHAEALEKLFPELGVDQKLKVMSKALEIWLDTKFLARQE